MPLTISCAHVRGTPPRRQENQASGGTATRRFTHQGGATSPMVMGGFYRETRQIISRKTNGNRDPERKEQSASATGTGVIASQTLQLQECGSGARASADDDFEWNVEFFAVPEFLQAAGDFRFGLSHFLGRKLCDQWAEGSGNFTELLPILLGRSRPMAIYDSGLLVNVAEARRFQGAA